MALTCIRNLGSNTTEDEYAADLGRIKTFQTWVLEEVLGGGGADTLVVLPYQVAQPNYRQDENA